MKPFLCRAEHFLKERKKIHFLCWVGVKSPIAKALRLVLLSAYDHPGGGHSLEGKYVDNLAEGPSK